MEKQKKKLELKLYRDTDEILTSWQIQDFISNLSSTYYKLDLINSICNKINLGVKEEEIFIIDESFKYNNSYKFLAKSKILKLNNKSDFKHFYHFGKPIGLFYNEKLSKLNIMFSIFEEINCYLGKKGLNKISKDKFHDVILECIDNGIKIFIDLIYLYNKDEEKISDIVNNIKVNIIDKYEEKLKELENNKENIRKVKDVILNKDSQSMNEKDFEFIEKKYFKRFFDYFMKLQRPIIGIYKEDKNEIEILSSSFIIKNCRDEKFLDIKQISHNSPTYINIMIGAIYALPITILLTNIIDIKNKSFKEKSDDDINKKKLEEARKNTCEITKDIKELEKLIHNENLEEHRKVENEYSNRSFNELNRNIMDRTLENIRNYGFENEKLESNIVDFEQVRKKIKKTK